MGGQDVDANISKTDFQESYLALIKFLVQKGCTVFVSGPLPRGDTDIKPHNAENLQDKQNNVYGRLREGHNKIT